MANIKTIALTGAETTVHISGQNCDIRNDGTDVVYASAAEGVVAGADGVLSIPAGGTAKLLDTCGAVYLLGTGCVQLYGNDYSESVFKSAASGGGITEDTVARTAINAHATNGEMHLTADDAVEAAATMISNPNQLINPDFRINQRGKYEYSSVGYAVDHWRLLYGSETMVQVVDDGIIVGNTNVASEHPAILGQHIENYAAFAGKTITISAEIIETTSTAAQLSLKYSVDGSARYSTLPIQSVGTHSATIHLPDNITALEIWLYGADIRKDNTSDQHTTFKWVKLEMGSVATPFTPPDPATELAKCQRYYQIRSAGDINAIDLRPSMMSADPAVTQLDNGNYSYSAEL